MDIYLYLCSLLVESLCHQMFQSTSQIFPRGRGRIFRLECMQALAGRDHLDPVVREWPDLPDCNRSGKFLSGLSSWYLRDALFYPALGFVCSPGLWWLAQQVRFGVGEDELDLKGRVAHDGVPLVGEGFVEDVHLDRLHEHLYILDPDT